MINVSNVNPLEVKLDKLVRALPEYRTRNELIVKLLNDGSDALIKKRKLKI